jgi:hypothetical protein
MNALMLAAVAFGAYLVLGKKGAPGPNVSGLTPDVGKRVLDAWKSEQGKKSDQSYDPVSGQMVPECASKARVWNANVQRWECVPVSPGKNEEAEAGF